MPLLPAMHLTDITAEATRVALWGRRAALEVRCPLPGVLRLRHSPVHALSWPEPRALPPKTSWAVVADEALPVPVRQEAGRLEVEAGGLLLSLALADGSWQVRRAGEEAPFVRCVRVEGEAVPDVPAPRYTSRLALEAPAGEAYCGFGEKVGPLDKRGMRLVFWNTDVLPHQPDTDPLYLSIPFFLAVREGRAWGLLLDETWRSEVDVAAEDSERLTWSSRGPELDVYVLAGPTPVDVLTRYTALTGRAPLPPLWSLGAHQSRWGYESAEEVRGIIRAYRAHRLPLDVVHLDIDHLDAWRVFTWDRSRFPAPAQLIHEAAEQGVRLVTIVDPALPADEDFGAFAEARAHDYLVRTGRGAVLLGEVWPRPAAFPDFTRPEVQAWWGGLFRAGTETGVAGYWLDMNEPSCFSLENSDDALEVKWAQARDVGRVEGPTLPYDAQHGARRHLEVHNVYGLGMVKGSWEGLRRLAPDRRPFLLTRAGFAGVQRFAAVWTGDNSSHWAHLELSVSMLLGLGLSGVAFAGVDVPGFLSRPTGELLVRWMQAGAFYPLLRNHSAKGTPPKEPWRFGEPFLTHARAALELRYRLLPTLYTLLQEASETGLPPLRPLFLHAPEESEALRQDDTFLLGRDLLVAPVVRPGHTARLVWLPRGRWLSLPNLEGPAGVVEGGGHHVAQAPLSTLPLFLREGGALALTLPALHTTEARWPALAWHVHVGPRVSGHLYEDAGEGYGAGQHTWLEGGFEADGTFRLTRRHQGQGRAPRSEEVLHLYGLPSHGRVLGARQVAVHAGELRLAVGADWQEVVVEPAG